MDGINQNMLEFIIQYSLGIKTYAIMHWSTQISNDILDQGQKSSSQKINKEDQDKIQICLAHAKHISFTSYL